mmetsp:Transcript_4277/g.6118  ORF Transcript_4277/g.6118 Transcript_4277/m.6118 type:complete len:261 (+) Transcript_4277:720-1502(+)
MLAPSLHASTVSAPNLSLRFKATSSPDGLNVTVCISTQSTVLILQVILSGRQSSPTCLARMVSPRSKSSVQLQYSLFKSSVHSKRILSTSAGSGSVASEQPKSSPWSLALGSQTVPPLNESLMLLMHCPAEQDNGGSSMSTQLLDTPVLLLLGKLHCISTSAPHSGVGGGVANGSKQSSLSKTSEQIAPSSEVPINESVSVSQPAVQTSTMPPRLPITILGVGLRTNGLGVLGAKRKSWTDPSAVVFFNSVTVILFSVSR